MSIRLSSVLATAVVAAAAHAAPANFFNDFNTTGAGNDYSVNNWQYGYASAAGGAISAFTDYGPTTNTLSYWHSPANENSLVPAAFYNPTGGTTTYGIAGGQAALHGGLRNDLGVASYQVSTSGLYRISGSFLAGDSGAVDNYVYAGGALRTIDLGQTASTPFDFTAYLTAGQTVDFYVGTAGSYGNDSTPLDANIAAVPGPGALAVFGLGMVGKLRRRRKA